MNPTDRYEESYRRQMDAFQEGLWAHLDAVPSLQPVTRDAVLSYLLELACQAQNVQNITLGRKAILSLPREWLLCYIERYAEPLLQLEDEWEYRRLGEIYEQLEHDLARRLALRGLASRDGGIREAARDLQGQLDCVHRS